MGVMTKTLLSKVTQHPDIAEWAMSMLEATYRTDERQWYSQSA